MTDTPWDEDDRPIQAFERLFMQRPEPVLRQCTHGIRETRCINVAIAGMIRGNGNTISFGEPLEVLCGEHCLEAIVSAPKDTIIMFHRLEKERT